MILNTFFYHPKVNLLAMIIIAIGFITAFLILLLFIDDYETDRCYPDYRRIYRVETRLTMPGGVERRSPLAPLPLIDALAKDPRIEQMGYALRLSIDIHSEGRVSPAAEVFAVSAGFLALINPFYQTPGPPGAKEIYITPAFNRQYLGFAAPKGRFIELGDLGRFMIKDVLQPRLDSSLAMPALIVFSPSIMAGYHDKRGDWHDPQVFLFIRSAGHRPFDRRLLDTLTQRVAPSPAAPEIGLRFTANAMRHLHYDHGQNDDVVVATSRRLLSVLYGGAGWVLLTTVVSFLNVNAIIQAAKRPGLLIKRSLGATDRQLVAESAADVFLQYVSACILAMVVLMVLSTIPGDVAALLVKHTGGFLATLFLAVMLLTGGVVLSCQAFLLYFMLLTAGGKPSRLATLIARYLNRIGLVMPLCLGGIIAFTWAGMTAQRHYALQADAGYHQSGLLTFELNERLASAAALHALQNRLNESAAGPAIALSDWRPFATAGRLFIVQHARQPAEHQYAAVRALTVNRDFAQVWGLETLAGTENGLAPSDDPSVSHIMVTRAFLGLMGLSSYDEALNTTFYTDVDGKKRRLRIVRVVDNFSLGEYTRRAAPLMLFITDTARQKYAAVGFDSAAQRERITAVLKLYGLADRQIRTVEALYSSQIRHGPQVLATHGLAWTLALALMSVCALVMGLSEAGRLAHPLWIMVALGGSVYTSVAFFLWQNLMPLAVALIISLACGGYLLHRWLAQFDMISGLAYTYGVAAALALVLAVMVIMVAALLAGEIPSTRGGRRLTRWM